MNELLRKYKNLPLTIKATLWFIICSTIQKAITILTVPIFARMLTKEQYGQYSVYTSWLQIFTMICTFRLDYAVFNKGMSKFQEQRDAYTSSMQGLTSFITLCVAGIYLAARNEVNAFTELPTFITLAMLGELFFSPAFGFWSLRKRYDFRYKEVVFTTLLLSILNPIVGIIMVLISDEKGYARIISCIAVQSIFGAVFYFINLAKGKKLVKKKFWKFALCFNVPLIPHYFSSYIIDQSDRIMIQKMCGISSVALYSVAYNAGAIMKIVTTSVTNAIIPWQYRQLEKGNYGAIQKQLLPFMVAISSLVSVFSLLAPEMINILAGKQYEEAIYVIPPVSASLFFVFVYGIFANIEFYYDANKFTAFITFVGAGVNLLLNYLFIPVFGYVAAAYTTLLSYGIICIGHFFFAQKIVMRRTGRKIFSYKLFAALSVAVVFASLISALLYSWMSIRYAILLIAILFFAMQYKRFIGYWKNMKEQ